MMQSDRIFLGKAHRAKTPAAKQFEIEIKKHALLD
jgi:hypothetical protein